MHDLLPYIVITTSFVISLVFFKKITWSLQLYLFRLKVRKMVRSKNRSNWIDFLNNIQLSDPKAVAQLEICVQEVNHYK